MAFKIISPNPYAKQNAEVIKKYEKFLKEIGHDFSKYDPADELLNLFEEDTFTSMSLGDLYDFYLENYSKEDVIEMFDEMFGEGTGLISKEEFIKKADWDLFRIYFNNNYGADWDTKLNTPLILEETILRLLGIREANNYIEGENDEYDDYNENTDFTRTIIENPEKDIPRYRKLQSKNALMKLTEEPVGSVYVDEDEDVWLKVNDNLYINIANIWGAYYGSEGFSKEEFLDYSKKILAKKKTNIEDYFVNKIIPLSEMVKDMWENSSEPNPPLSLINVLKYFPNLKNKVPNDIMASLKEHGFIKDSAKDSKTEVKDFEGNLWQLRKQFIYYIDSVYGQGSAFCEVNENKNFLECEIDVPITEDYESVDELINDFCKDNQCAYQLINQSTGPAPQYISNIVQKLNCKNPFKSFEEMKSNSFAMDLARELFIKNWGKRPNLNDPDDQEDLHLLYLDYVDQINDYLDDPKNKTPQIGTQLVKLRIYNEQRENPEMIEKYKKLSSGMKKKYGMPIGKKSNDSKIKDSKQMTFEEFLNGSSKGDWINFNNIDEAAPYDYIIINAGNGQFYNWDEDEFYGGLDSKQDVIENIKGFGFDEDDAAEELKVFKFDVKPFAEIKNIIDDYDDSKSSDVKSDIYKIFKLKAKDSANKLEIDVDFDI